MFAKRLFKKAVRQHNLQPGNTGTVDLDFQIPVHYGIPSTSSIMAFDPIQCLLAIGTLDGRIKIIGGDNIEGLFIFPNKLPFKFLEFFYNQGFIVGVSNGNEIQVWDLEKRCLTCSLQWECNITAFTVIQGTNFMYSGDENGLLSVLKFDAIAGEIFELPYHVPVEAVKESTGISFSGHTVIVGILQQPYTSGERVLIAYEEGVMVLWDISEVCAVAVRGHTHLQLKGEEVGDPSKVMDSNIQDLSDGDQVIKEICSLCWASNTGSLLAVGYIDGDILLWTIPSETHLKKEDATRSSNNVVKLDLSSGGRRLPVIVLQWSTDSTPENEHRGKLFVYGGDEIGSDEVLTVLSLDWSSGIQRVKCIARVDISLHGSFANMTVIPRPGGMENTPAAGIFILTNPGQLHIYDISSLSESRPQDCKPEVNAVKFPLTIPTTDPSMTVTKFYFLPTDGDLKKALSKKDYTKRVKATPSFSMNMRWPLTGGVPSGLFFEGDVGIERIYVAGYQDGSVRIWDATHPVLTLLHIIVGKVDCVELPSGISSVSALDFSSATLCLAVGNESGLVFLYDLSTTVKSDEQGFHFVTGSEHQVHVIQHENEDIHCLAVFSLSNSAVTALHFSKSNSKLVVGFLCGEVTMLDLTSMSLLFRVDHSFILGSPIYSLDMRVLEHVNAPVKGITSDVLFILAKNAHVISVDGVSGNILSPKPIHPQKESTAISMYVIDGSNFMGVTNQKHPQEGPRSGSRKESGEVTSSLALLICCEDALRLYPLKSVIEGGDIYIKKVVLPRQCCWTSLVRSKDRNEAHALLLLYQNGVLEIRSLSNLEVLEEYPLMSILRWSFKTNIIKTMSASDYGQISLVNGSEMAVISIFAGANDFRIPESLPSLHDKVLAAAAEAATSLSIAQKRREDSTPGIIGGFLKGLKRGKSSEISVNAPETSSSISPKFLLIQRLENCFSRDPFATSAEQVEFDIDDISIDEDPSADPASKEAAERKELFRGANEDIKPRIRTTEEILTKYKFSGDAAAAAAHAKDKLALRQEKLQRTKEQTEELQNEAENFASMAKELAKRMEAKKWWKL